MRCLVLALFCTLGGCTHVGTIQSERVLPLPSDKARTGVSYALPMIQYDMSLVRMLDQCDPETLTPKFAVATTASHRYVEGERFEVDPTSLSSIFKTTSLSIERYEDQNTLKALNAASDDKTGDTLAAIARVGVAISGMAFGLPAYLKSGSDFKTLPDRYQWIECSELAMSRLDEVEVSIQALKSLNSALARKDAEIATHKALADLKSYPAESMRTLVELSEQQVQIANEIYATQSNLASSKEGVSLPLQKIIWPPDDAKSATSTPLEHVVPFDVNKKHTNKLCELFVLVTEETASGSRLRQVGNKSPETCAAVKDIALQSAQVRLALKSDAQAPYDSNAKVAMSETVARAGVNKGVFYRDPVRGRLVVETQNADMEWSPIWQDEPQWIPQLGDLRFLPMKSGPFENEVLSLSLRRDGRIEKFSYETKDAAIVRVAQSAASIAEKIQTEMEKQRKSERDNEKYLRETDAAVRLDEIAKIQAQIDLRMKQQQLVNEQDVDAIAYRLMQTNLDAEIKILTAQITQLRLANELEAQRAR
jgi:hypothetical protein